MTSDRFKREGLHYTPKERVPSRLPTDSKGLMLNLLPKPPPKNTKKISEDP